MSWSATARVFGGLSAVHQFVRIGQHAMVGGVTGVERDVIPLRLGDGRSRAAARPQHRRHAAPRLLARRHPGAAHRLSAAVPRRRHGTFAERVAEVASALSRVRTVRELLDFIARRNRRAASSSRSPEWRVGSASSPAAASCRCASSKPAARLPAPSSCSLSKGSPIRRSSPIRRTRWMRLGAAGEGLRAAARERRRGARAGRRRAAADSWHRSGRIGAPRNSSPRSACARWATTACCARSSPSSKARASASSASTAF